MAEENRTTQNNSDTALYLIGFTRIISDHIKRQNIDIIFKIKQYITSSLNGIDIPMYKLDKTKNAISIKLTIRCFLALKRTVIKYISDITNTRI